MTSRGVKLTERDVKLLRLLFDYGVVSSTQISRWLFQGIKKTTVLRRLRRLEEGSFIRKRGTLPDGTAVLMIDGNGADFWGEKLKVTTFPMHLLLHEIEINNLRWRLAALGLVKTWMTERTLRFEIMRRNIGSERSNLIVPDALILFRHFLAPNAKVELEMELHMKSDQRYRARFEKFDPARQVSPSFCWYFVRTRACGERILSFAKKYGGYNAEKCIGYTVIDEFLKNGIEAKLILHDGAKPLYEVFSVPRPAQGDAQGLSTQKQQVHEPVAA